MVVAVTTLLVGVSAVSAKSLSSTSGGGWIPVGIEGMGTFAVSAKVQDDGTFAGHLVYHDHAAGFSMKSTSILSYMPCTGVIVGVGESDIGPVQYFAIAQDNGEPGTADAFTLAVFDAEEDLIYSATGLLGGGNIQGHGPACL